jgi:hypothetical protein
MGSQPLIGDVTEMSDGEATPTSHDTEGVPSDMSDEQIEIMALTVSDVAEALNDVPEDLAQRIRGQQEDVAETRRRAQANEDLLRLRVS